MASKRLRELLYKTRGIYKYYIESFVIELVDPKGSEIVRVENTKRERCLTSETVQSTSLPLEGVDYIHSGDSLPLGMLGVCDGITDDVLQEHLEDTTGLLVDEAGDPLDSSPPRQTADGGLGDALDVVPQHLTVTLGASLSQSLASFTTTLAVITAFFYEFA